MRVLVTGAGGFVGTAMCRRLADAGVDVVAAVRQAASAPPAAFQTIVREVHGEARWDDSLRGVSGIVHLAARVHVMDDRAGVPLDEFRRVNVQGTSALARGAAACGVRRFVFVSSVKVHGEERDAPYTEHDEPAPQDAYGKSKWEAEQALRTIERETGMEVTVVRPPLVYGPNVRANFLKLMEAVRRRVPLPFRSVHNRRSLLYVGNLADAIARCLVHPAAAGRTYLISDGEDVSTAELIQRLGEAMDVPVRLLPAPAAVIRLAARLAGRDAEIGRLVGSLSVDSRAIREQLEWRPPYSLREGLAATAAAYWSTHAR